MYKSFWDIEDVDKKELYELIVYHLGKTPVFKWDGIKEKQDYNNLYFYSSHTINYSGTVHTDIFNWFKCLTNNWKIKFIQKIK